MIGRAPARNCDVIMKGGITSGVVYPLAIVELAEEFRFRNIGGTSAGAIAAAVTAAAEYRRLSENGSTAGFEKLQELPDFLAGTTDGEPNLLNLFPPVKPMRKLYSVATAFLGDAPFAEKAVTAFASLLTVSPLLTILCFLPALLLPVAMRAQLQLGPIARFTLFGAIVAELALLASGVLLLILGHILQALLSTLPKNHFGFSTGRAPADRKLPGVSDWLHRELQQVAGRPETAPPLTFGDLWLADVPIEDREQQLAAAAADNDLRAINLQMVATGLSHGQPYRLPFENRIFAFRESELRRYFPDDVVDHLVAKSVDRDDVTAIGDPDLHALPEPWDLPIVVAARMSLSFPVLFAMVPLYAVDFTQKVAEGQPRNFERCWFIDGGLSSNFPLTLFDSPFPRWPTFAINLKEFHPAYPKDPDHEANNVWMIKGAGSGTGGQWTRFPATGAGAVAGWIGAMLDTIRNWRDNTQGAVPGFRDRIVHVKLTKDEGGLNLNMDAKKVRALSERGRWAGRRLRERFGEAGAKSDPLNWNSHRWTRYRTSMALLQKTMRQMQRAFAHQDPAYPDYNALLERGSDENPKTGYWWPRTPADFRTMTNEFLQLAAKLQTPPACNFDDQAPFPKPELRITPRL
jgi:predicted acylesterase/phospholipase RssA